ncbi:adenylate kinase 8 isoform X3 [Scyliorhinus torazame]|uniref:adenylate kinase 8 isoform X3 n=1 Tax=Scyliorhinus torazame TaxID=75743 RepID=UPI003B598874
MDATKKPFRISPELGVYAEKHGIFQILQRLLQGLLVDKPMEPIQYMIDHLKSENDEVPRVFLLGPPASGKLTIAKLLCDKLGSNFLTLENMMANKSDVVNKIQRFSIKNKEIPNTLWAKLILERLSKTDCIKRGWILVGYPKTRDQALALQENGIAPEHIVILDAPDTVLIERNLGKRIDMSTGEIYHTTFNWPTSSKVQKRLVKPNGVKEEETVKALLEYRRVCHGILNSYSKKYHVVNADQPSVDVFSQVSCGQLLKEPVAAETRLGEAIKPYVESRQPVPDVMVMKCISQRLSKLDCSTRGWVLHGFPQDAGQAEMLKDAGFSPNRVFFLDVPDDAAIERLTVRLTDPVTGERYHSIYKPAPTSEVYSRCKIHPKDSEENVQQALEVYHANVVDLEEFYNAVIHVNADQDPYTVFEYIESCVVKPLSKHTNVFV